MVNTQGVEKPVDVALKEMRIKDDVNSIDDFQHEVSIMRYELPLSSKSKNNAGSYPIITLSSIPQPQPSLSPRAPLNPLHSLSIHY